MNIATSFKILGIVVKPDIEIEEVKRAYRLMAKKFHPDHFHHNHILKQQAESRMKEINLAFKTACDFVKTLPKVEKKRDGVSTSKKSEKPDVRNEKNDKSQRTFSNFFKWCKNIISSKEIVLESDDIVIKEKIVAAPSSIKSSNPQEQKSSSPKTPHFSATKNRKNRNSSHFYGECNFDEFLRKSEESFKDRDEVRKKTCHKENFADMEKERAYAKSALKPENSPFKYVKRKKKFIDSYAGPVEKVAPISSVNKI